MEWDKDGGDGRWGMGDGGWEMGDGTTSHLFCLFCLLCVTSWLREKCYTPPEEGGLGEGEREGGRAILCAFPVVVSVFSFI